MDRMTSIVGEILPGQYIVERILKKRIVDRKPQYFIRWKGYGKEDDSWAAKDDIWSGLVEEFEMKLKKKLKKKDARNVGKGSSRIVMKRKSSACSTKGNDKDDNEIESVPGKASEQMNEDFTKKMTGFDRGLQAEKILDIDTSKITGELMFLIKWNNCEVPEFVSHQEVKDKCPQVLIAFYEANISWDSESVDEDD